MKPLKQQTRLSFRARDALKDLDSCLATADKEAKGNQYARVI